MTFSRNKLYLIISLACAAGYMWLYLNASNYVLVKNNTFEVCIIKHVTHIPCPSCGSTRSVLLLQNGEFLKAFTTNPLGYLISIILIFAPLWMMIDVLAKKNSLLHFYKKLETYLKIPTYNVPLLLLLILNWIWNITKEL